MWAGLSVFFFFFFVFGLSSVFLFFPFRFTNKPYDDESQWLSAVTPFLKIIKKYWRLNSIRFSSIQFGFHLFSGFNRGRLDSSLRRLFPCFFYIFFSVFFNIFIRKYYDSCCRFISIFFLFYFEMFFFLWVFKRYIL